VVANKEKRKKEEWRPQEIDDFLSRLAPLQRRGISSWRDSDQKIVVARASSRCLLTASPVAQQPISSSAFGGNIRPLPFGELTRKRQGGCALRAEEMDIPLEADA
jgi:hypothetical protein